jgi:hypothetical protein
LLVLAWARVGRARWTHILLGLFACGAAAYAVRLVPVAAVIVAPLLAGAVARLRGTGAPRLSTVELGALATAVGVSAVALALLTPHTSSEPGGVPTGLTQELGQLDPGSTVFVEGNEGAWIEWRFPALHPTVDGMFDAYELGYLQDYQAAIGLRPGWEEFVRGTEPDVALVRTGSAFGHALQEELGWRTVGTDSRWSLLRP